MKILFEKHHKVIYVCHPYGGELDNVISNAKIMAFLDKNYHNKTFVSPIFCWGYKDYSHVGTARKKDMENCKRLLARCDAVLMTGDWIKSRGCVEEVEFAMFANKKIYEYTQHHHLKKCEYNELVTLTNKISRK